ncbi:MAG: calcium/sodium antiporter [Deltaproteobacteria bacterium]|nr:calcium/sodium antiporter [Deltaproteobacteria bacterium]
MLLQVILLIVGFALLYCGAEWLVKGSANLAKSLGVSSVVIGLTVVAFGTSAPELVVSVVASIQNKSMIAVGNVVGSNICNIALILGIASFLIPITANRSVVRRDIPLMLAISALLFILSLDSYISRTEGVELFTGVILYTAYNYYLSARDKRTAVRRGATQTAGPLDTELSEIGYIESRFMQIFLILLGIAGVVIGARVMIYAAVVLMRNLGVSEKFVGLTIVAFGTSLPELATSVVAALKKQMDISIGNLVGSNVFNILSVIGMAAIIRPVSIPGGFIKSGLVVDYVVMILVSFLPLVMMWKDNTVKRRDGFILLCCYFGYLSYLIHRG